MSTYKQGKARLSRFNVPNHQTILQEKNGEQERLIKVEMLHGAKGQLIRQAALSVNDCSSTNEEGHINNGAG
jgi:hypothetical protein